MHIRRVIVAALTTGLAVGTAVMAQNGNPLNPNSKNILTLAVYGDAPYGLNPTDTTQTDKTLAFIDSINRDPKVDLVLHTGDIHSGKQFCTENYNWTIYNLWLSFKNPLIYIPGDNEWSDCHKAAQGGHVYLDPPTNSMPVDYADGDPPANLALVRSIFFADPGYSLGGRKKQVLTQASTYNAASPSDTHYVENVMWEQSRVLFVTANVPGGSNNDSDNWYGAGRTAAQTNEIAERTQADLHWLDAAFAQAQRDGAVQLETGGAGLHARRVDQPPGVQRAEFPSRCGAWQHGAARMAASDDFARHECPGGAKHVRTVPMGARATAELMLQ